MTDKHHADRLHPRLIAMFSLLYLFAFQLLVDFVEGIYAFGLAGSSIPPEIIAVLLFFSPLLMLAFRKGPPPSVIIVTALLLAVSRAVEVMLPTLGRMLVAGIGVACFMVLLPSLIWLQSRGNIKKMVLNQGVSLVLAVSMAVMVRVVNSSLDFTTDGSLRWVGFLVALALCGLILWQRGEFLPADSRSITGPKAGTSRVTALALGIIAALLMLYFAFTAPNLIERWTGENYLLILAVLSSALIIFSAVLLIRPAWLLGLHPVLVWVWNLVFVTGLVVTIFLHQTEFPRDPGAYPLYAGQVSGWSTVILLGTVILFPVVLLDFILYYRELLAARPSYRQLGAGFSIAALFVLVMVLSHVFTTVYDYIPVIGPAFRDQFWLVYLVLGTGMALPILAVRAGEDDARVGFRRGGSLSATFSLVIILAVITVAAAVVFAPRPEQQAGEKRSMKILTYNIQQGYSDGDLKNYDGQLDLIREVDADIIGLQESDTNRIANGNADVVRYFAERLNMYTYFGPKTVTGTFGDALLSKYPIENPRTFYMYSEGEQTATIEAQITVNGETFNVYVTHLGNRGPMIQQQQVLEVVEGKENVILIGDFNFRPYEEQYALTTGSLDDAWIVRWPGGNQEQGIDPDERIDHTFLTPGTAVEESEYIADPASDHPAMWTVISW